MKEDNKVQTIGVKSCARCGGNHDSLQTHQLDNHEKYQRWAMCPEVQQPILIQVIEVD